MDEDLCWTCGKAPLLSPRHFHCRECYEALYCDWAIRFRLLKGKYRGTGAGGSDYQCFVRQKGVEHEVGIGPDDDPTV